MSAPRDTLVAFVVQEHAAAILAAREAERAYQDALERAEKLADIRAALMDESGGFDAAELFESARAAFSPPPPEPEDEDPEDPEDPEDDDEDDDAHLARVSAEMTRRLSAPTPARAAGTPDAGETVPMVGEHGIGNGKRDVDPDTAIGMIVDVLTESAPNWMSTTGIAEAVAARREGAKNDNLNVLVGKILFKQRDERVFAVPGLEARRDGKRWEYRIARRVEAPR